MKMTKYRFLSVIPLEGTGHTIECDGIDLNDRDNYESLSEDFRAYFFDVRMEHERIMREQGVRRVETIVSVGGLK